MESGKDRRASAAEAAELAKDIQPAVRKTFVKVVARSLERLERDDLSVEELRDIHHQVRAAVGFAREVDNAIKGGPQRGDE